MNPDNPNFKMYGSSPHSVVLVHGGPAAIGYLAPLAKKLSGTKGIIDAFQTKCTIAKLIEELHEIISMQAKSPVTLIGHSWGAWLSILYTSLHKEAKVKKLILVASPPFHDDHAGYIMNTRLNRLDANTSVRLFKLMNDMETFPINQKNKAFLEIAFVFRQVDAFELENIKPPKINFNFEQYNAVWDEAKQLRSSGDLLRHTGQINCPVIAIHGNHDPHPAEGVDLSQQIKDFRFILLEKCGHEPWFEKHAKTQFFELLQKEIV